MVDILAVKKRLQRLGSAVVRGLADDRSRCDLRLPRLQPRGSAPGPGRLRFTYTLETIIQAGKMLIPSVTSRSGRTRRRASRGSSPRCGVRPAKRARDLPRLHDVRAAAGLPRRGGVAASSAPSSGSGSSSTSRPGDGHGHVSRSSSVDDARDRGPAGRTRGPGRILAAIRLLLQRTLERIRRLELQLGVEPSHYVHGDRPQPGAPVQPAPDA